ncbi:hypothetical protein ACJJTC_008192 [Scirpophaga incertulas]
MSVCFFVPADQPGASTTPKVEPVDQETETEPVPISFGPTTLQEFWVKVMEDIKKVTSEDFKTQSLPLARIKKIMKLDEDVKMISAEAPVLFAKAAEIFIHELTMRAWAHTEDNKRRTLQRNDIAMALAKSDQFDFLIDIVPRHETKMSKPREDPLRNTATPDHHIERTNHQPQAPQPQQQANVQTQTTPQPMTPSPSPGPSVVTPQPVTLVQQLVTPTGEMQQVPTSGSGSAAGVVTPQPVTLIQQLVTPTGDVQQVTTAGSGTAAGVVTPQPVALVQQLVTPTGEIQQVPIQLTQSQLSMIRLHVQNNPNQPFIIQAQPQSPQIIQVSSQAQHAGPQPVFLAQVAPTSDDS